MAENLPPIGSFLTAHIKYSLYAKEFQTPRKQRDNDVVPKFSALWTMLIMCHYFPEFEI